MVNAAHPRFGGHSTVSCDGKPPDQPANLDPARTRLDASPGAVSGPHRPIPARISRCGRHLATHAARPCPGRPVVEVTGGRREEPTPARSESARWAVAGTSPPDHPTGWLR